MTEDDSAKEKILACLRAYHGGNLYLMGPRPVVTAGFELHHAGEVTSIEWAKNFSCLHLRMGHAGRVVVNVRAQDERLLFSCTCSSKSDEGGCEHAVCAVLTLKNLLMPEVFKPREADPVYRKALLEGLTGASQDKSIKPVHAGYSIVLEQKESGPDVFVARDGRPVTKLAELLHSPLVAFAAPDLPFHQKINALTRFLATKGDTYPILIKIGQKETKARFSPDHSLKTFTELAVNSSEVSVIKGLRDSDGRKFDFLLFGDLVYLPDSGRLCAVGDAAGWEPWKNLQRELIRTGVLDEAVTKDHVVGFTLPDSSVEKMEATLTAAARKKSSEILFTVDGKKINSVRIEGEPRLTIELPDTSVIATLRAERAYGDRRRTVSLGAFFEELEELPRPLQSGRARESLLRAFFELLLAGEGESTNKFIDSVIAETGTAGTDLKGHVRDFLLRSAEAFRADAVQVGLHQGEWVRVSGNLALEARLFTAVLDVFGQAAFDDMAETGSMSVQAGVLHERLSLLYDRLAGTGVNLYFKGKPVKKARWEFAVNAEGKAGIDWFEIRPEIRCDGDLLDGASLNVLFGGSPVLEQDTVVRILDSNAQNIMNRIAAAYRSGDSANRREREIVRIPRLQILDWAALRKSGVSVQLPKEDEEIVERLLNFERIGKKALPEKLQATLRHYQREGYHWLAFLYEHRLGACLADDMGLGKTVQAISLLGAIQEGIVRSPGGAVRLPHLIVVPPSLVFNWEQELQKFYPGIRTHIYTGSERSADFGGAGAVITTYGTIRKDIEVLKDRRFHVIVFDEAQAVKNLHADTTGAVRRLKGLFKLTVTGTPVENHLGEYYSVVDLAVPGLLGDYDRFRPLIKSGASTDLDVIIARTRPFVLRRTKEAVLHDLPARTETDIYLELTEEQKALYQKTVEQVRATAQDAYQKKTEAQARIVVLAAIVKLRQICITPQLVDTGLTGVSPKMDFLIEQLRELIEENHSSLVFSQFTSFLDILGAELEKSGIRYLRLDGSTPTQKRKALVSEFQTEKGPPVFLLSLKAGGQGLNLTRASYVFHLDPWWNPAVENQASDRAHRIGQKNKVTITRLLMRHTIEEKMMELKKRKKALYDAILEGGEKAGQAAITRGDFDFLLGEP